MDLPQRECLRHGAQRTCKRRKTFRRKVQRFHYSSHANREFGWTKHTTTESQRRGTHPRLEHVVKPLRPSAILGELGVGLRGTLGQEVRADIFG